MGEHVPLARKAKLARNYSELNSGKSANKNKGRKKDNKMEETDIEDTEGMQEVTLAPDNDDFEEDPSDWEDRRKAVSDENFQKQYDAFQEKMRQLNERELVLEREQKLMEMQQQMMEREESIKRKERELAAKAPSFRYQGAENSKLRVSFAEHDKVQNWVDSQQFTTVKGKKAPFQTKREMLATANALIDDDCLEQCRVTGTSRLNTMGLSRKQLSTGSLHVRRQNAPVIGTMPGLVTQIQPSAGASAGQLGAMANAETRLGAKQSLIGQVDDGESVHSFCSIRSDIAKGSDCSNAKKKVKSGMYDKIADDVVFKLKWPHKKLSKSWVPERLQMHQLTFEQVVAGEISIIMKSEDPEEVRCRLHILQKLAYWNMQGQGWPRVRDIYCAILHSIEEGDANWQSTFREYDHVFPVRNVSRPKMGKARDVFWCREFNRGDCKLESGHKALVAGQERSVLHICASCWKAGKKEKHREPECPNREI